LDELLFFGEKDARALFFHKAEEKRKRFQDFFLYLSARLFGVDKFTLVKSDQKESFLFFLLFKFIAYNFILQLSAENRTQMSCV
jgi:hypothetical protein